jgi:hypothetical protein
MKKTGRNDPCPCGSGKKFKKCCEKKMIGKRFLATKIDTGFKEVKKSDKLSSVFKVNVDKPKEETKEMDKSKFQVKPPVKKEKEEEDKSS